MTTGPSTLDAVVAGLGAMLGAGVFAGLAPASALAGRWLLLGAVIAGLIALCSAFSTADHASADPGSGGGYRYTREQLGRLPGRMAGGVYLVGRAAAAAALADCFGNYATPSRPMLTGVVVVLAAVAADAAGIRLSRTVTRVLVGFVLVVLAIVIACCFAIAPPAPTGVPLPAGFPGSDNVGELLPAAGVMFFCFLGFERITAPAADHAVIPRKRLVIAVPVLIVLALGSYLAVSAAVLHQLGPNRLALSPVPLTDAMAAADATPIAPLVSMAALAATAGALLLVVGGARRTAEVMAGRGDLPPTPKTPGHGRLRLPAAVLIGVGSVVATVLLSPTRAIVLAATCALAYYAFTNAAARLLLRGERVWPARSACFGLGLCVLVALVMPSADLVVALFGMAAGLLLGPLATAIRGARRYVRHRG
ncbi:MAG TPA: APC family permease [Pseudonocardiaceae bacterium]|nr:APC family permease [Pseudonocardiaceae bacterium]